jgi:hypothetical protein
VWLLGCSRHVIDNLVWPPKSTFDPGKLLPHSQKNLPPNRKKLVQAVMQAWSCWPLSILAILSHVVSSNHGMVPGMRMDCPANLGAVHSHQVGVYSPSSFSLILRLSGGTDDYGRDSKRIRRDDSVGVRERKGSDKKTSEKEPAPKEKRRQVVDSSKEKKTARAQEQAGKSTTKSSSSSSSSKTRAKEGTKDRVKGQAVEPDGTEQRRGSTSKEEKPEEFQEPGEAEDRVMRELRTKTVGHSVPEILVRSTFEGLFDISPHIDLPGHTGLTLEHFRTERFTTDADGNPLEEGTYR